MVCCGLLKECEEGGRWLVRSTSPSLFHEPEPETEVVGSARVAGKSTAHGVCPSLFSHVATRTLKEAQKYHAIAEKNLVTYTTEVT